MTRNDMDGRRRPGMARTGGRARQRTGPSATPGPRQGCWTRGPWMSDQDGRTTASCGSGPLRRSHEIITKRHYIWGFGPPQDTTGSASSVPTLMPVRGDARRRRPALAIVRPIARPLDPSIGRMQLACATAEAPAAPPAKPNAPPHPRRLSPRDAPSASGAIQRRKGRAASRLAAPDPPDPQSPSPRSCAASAAPMPNRAMR
jgi:hypothetical protein